MLHWLAGQKQPDGPNDPNATGYIEPPETPAPVFAVRAFKHAIFGTPQTAQPKPRRNSANDNPRPRHVDSRPPRPGMARPKSSSDATALARQQLPDVPEPLSSPTKGILLTPGTAAAKKKNVTFGDHVVDNEEKRPIRNGLSDDSPDAKFVDDSEKDEDFPEKRRGRGKLTEALEQARDESRKRKSKPDKRGKRDQDEDIDVPPEFLEPKSDSGKYWKHEYDSYRTNTQREVRKLITKQKAAKSFAQTKDTQCTELADDLQQERKRVESLEAKLEELTTLMKDLHQQLTTSQQSEQKQSDEIATLKRQMGRRDSTRPTSSDAAMLVPLERTTSGQRGEKAVANAEQDPVQRPSEPYRPSKETDRPKLDLQTLRARVKPKVDSNKPKQSEDIWAQSFGSSSPVATRAAYRGVATTGVHSVEAAPMSTALQSLDVNALGNGREPDRTSSPHSLDVECKSQPDEDKSKSGPRKHERPRDRSPFTSPDIPAAPLASGYFDSAIEQQRPTEPAQQEDLSIEVPISSPFQADAKPVPASRRIAPPAGPREAPAARPVQLHTNTKENVSPTRNTSKPSPPQSELHVKPSQLWSSINKQQPSRDRTNLTSKDGRTVSSDRIEAARARIAARGRVAS